MLPKSIRWRIQAWHGFLLTCIVTGLVIGFYKYERNSRFREVDTQLHQLVTPLLPWLKGGPPGPGREGRRRPPRELDGVPPRNPGENGRVENERMAPGSGENMPEPFRRERGPQGEDVLSPFKNTSYFYVAWSPDGEITDKSAFAPDFPQPQREDFWVHNPLRTRGEYRELIHFMPGGDCVVVGTSTAPIQAQLRQLAVELTLAGCAFVTLGLVGGWWLTGRAIRPIAEITSAAEKIAEGDLTKRINVQETESELGQLTSVLNQTFERLEQSFDQQVQFTADASHELRTPVSVMMTQIQLALSRPRSPEEYRQTLETCERAAERMRVLVNSLLELARVDSGEFELVREECDLGRIARESMEFIEPLAKNKNVSLRQSIESVRTSVDAMKIGQVLINLLNNAIQHNQEGIEICLSVAQNKTHVILRVVDNGRGIPKEALPNLFDRFYRLDKSRTNIKRNNTGLGLAICKAIVEAHDGTIRVESQPGLGAQFIVELPIVKNERDNSEIFSKAQWKGQEKSKA